MLHIPLARMSKKPLAGANWKDSATDDEDRIARWRARKLNLGTPTGSLNGLVVRDYDGPEGIELARAEFRSKLTREFFKVLVRSPNGGLHVYLKAPEFSVSNAVKVGGQPIDLRGDGGYVVATGSTLPAGRYEFVPGFELRDIEELPEFPEMWLPPKKEVITQSIEEIDVFRRITRARLWLATIEPAISGRNGHKTMFRACCKMFQKFDLTIDQAWPLILEYNERCEPPFRVETELKHKIEDACNRTRGS